MFYQTYHMFAAEITPQQRQNGPVCCCITLFAATTFHSVTAAGVMGVNSAFLSLVTMAFKVVRVRDQTHLPCEFAQIRSAVPKIFDAVPSGRVPAYSGPICPRP